MANEEVQMALAILAGVHNEELTKYVHQYSGVAYCARNPVTPEIATGNAGRNNSSGVNAFYACTEPLDVEPQLAQFGGRDSREFFRWDYVLNLFDAKSFCEKHGIAGALTITAGDEKYAFTQELSERARAIGCSGTMSPDVHKPTNLNIVLHLLDTQGKSVERSIFEKAPWPNQPKS